MRVNILIIILFAGFFLEVNSQENLSTAKKIILNGREYYIHVVQKGEGLYRIGVNYGVSQQEILDANDDITENLKLGQIIRIPVIDGRNSDIKEMANARSFIYHTVEKGQTAFFISRKYNVPLDAIYDNNQGTREKLSEGAILKIPIEQSVLEKSNSKEENNEEYINHTVKPKETLYGLAMEHNTTVEKIVEVNPALQNGTLTIGSTIRIPSNNINYESKTKITPDGTQQFIESDNYLYHTILQGQTYYSIARQYQVNEKDLHDANPGVSQENLKIGYLLRVPRPKFDNKQTENENLFTIHKVRKKETLYGISRIHNVDEITIKTVNPTVNFTNLKTGEQIKIPTNAWFAQQTAAVLQQTENNVLNQESNNNSDFQIVSTDCTNSTLGYEIPIKVALMLPFSAKEAQKYFNDTIDSSNANRDAALRSKPFIELYSGMLLAIEVLKKQGINIKLDVYDISSDNRAIEKALDNNDLRNVDLIIGPGVTKELQEISAFSNQYKIPLVYPMSNTNPELNHNPNIFHINTPDSLLHDIIVDEIIRQARGENLLVVITNSSDKESKKLTNLIKQKALAHNLTSDNLIKYNEYTSGKDDIVGIQALIDKDKRTFIVIPSHNQSEVSKLIPTIAGIKAKTKANITLFGMSSWLRMSTIDPEEIYQLNGTFFTSFALDYNDLKTKQFLENYRQMFYTEPFSVHPYFQNADANSSFSRYGIWGYDVSFYFITAIYKYGKYFNYCLDNYNANQIQFNFNFVRFSNRGGFYNNGLFMVRFNSDFKVERIRIKE